MHKGDLMTTVSGGAGTTGGAWFSFFSLYSLYPIRRRSSASCKRGIRASYPFSVPSHSGGDHQRARGERKPTGGTPSRHAKGLPLMYWMTRKTKRNIRRAYPRRARNCPLEVQRYCPSRARKTPPALPMTQRGDINHERKTKGHTSKKDRQR